MRRTVSPFESLISIVRFCRAVSTAPLFRVSLIHFVNSLLLSRPRVIVDLAGLPRAGLLADDLLALRGHLTDLDDLLLDGHTADLLDGLDEIAAQLNAEDVGGKSVALCHDCLSPFPVGEEDPGGHSLTRLVLSENCASRKTTNSAGLTGATPISHDDLAEVDRLLRVVLPGRT